METAQSLKSRRAWPQYLGLAALFAVGGIEIWAVISGLMSGALVWHLLSSVFLVVVFVQLFGNGITRAYEVLPDALVIISWGKQQVIAWEHITEIDVLSAFFGRTNLLVAHGNESSTIASAQFANHKTPEPSDYRERLPPQSHRQNSVSPSATFMVILPTSPLTTRQSCDRKRFRLSVQIPLRRLPSR